MTFSQYLSDGPFGYRSFCSQPSIKALYLRVASPSFVISMTIRCDWTNYGVFRRSAWLFVRSMSGQVYPEKDGLCMITGNTGLVITHPFKIGQRLFLHDIRGVVVRSDVPMDEEGNSCKSS